MNKNTEFLYRLSKMKTTDNAPIIEGIAKAFGKIKGIDPTISENDTMIMESIETLEAARNGSNGKAFFESITSNALENATEENIGDVRNGLNAYKTWLIDHHQFESAKYGEEIPFNPSIVTAPTPTYDPEDTVKMDAARKTIIDGINKGIYGDPEIGETFAYNISNGTCLTPRLTWGFIENFKPLMLSSSSISEILEQLYGDDRGFKQGIRIKYVRDFSKDIR